MAYGNYGLVVDSRFKARSFDDLIKPLAMYTQEYNALEQGINELDTKASIWENMANEQTDKNAYRIYKNYADDLRSAADQLASQGLSKMSRPALMNLKSRYSKEIVPIEQAYNTRQKQAEEQQKALLQDPTLLLSRRAATTSLDDYINNPQLAYEAYSGKLLTAQAATAAQALAKQMRDNPRKWRDILHGAYYETLMQKGFTSQDVLEAIQRSPQAKQELLKIMDDVVGSSKIATWKNPEALRRAYEYAGQGLWSGVGETQYQMVQNPDHLNALQRAQLRQIRQQQQDRALKMNDPGLTDFYSKSDIAKKNQGYINLYKDFRKKRYITEAGQLTRAGLKEYNRITGKITALDLQGTGKMPIKDVERSTRTPLYNFLKDLGYKPTGNGRQDLLHINNLLKQTRHNIITGNVPIGDIQFKVARIPVTAEQSKQLAGQIGARADILEGVGRMTKKGNDYQLLSKADDKLTSSDIAALMDGKYEIDGESVRIANVVGVPYTTQAVLELTNGKRYILPKDLFSDAAIIGMATGYGASMVQDATPQQKAFGITYGNTYLSSILNTTEPQQTKWVDSNAVSIP